MALSINEEIHNDSQKIANIFATSFSSVYVNENNSDLPDLSIWPDLKEKLVKFDPPTQAEISSVIDALRNDSSPGPDGISNKFIKNLKFLFASNSPILLASLIPSYLVAVFL